MTSVEHDSTRARRPSPLDRWRTADRSTRAYWIGILAAGLLLAGSGWYQAWAVPPYRYTDEQAHVGYVLELQAGRLPQIETPIDGAAGGPALQDRLALTAHRHGEVWVANNPPTAYLIDVVPAALTRALGWPGGPLMGMRLTNLAFMAAAVMLLARLATRLAGGDRRVGLVAAGTMAALPHVSMIAGTVYNDGLGLLCSIAMLDALVAMTVRGPTRRQIMVLSAWCALGAGVRPMTAVLAGATAAMALAVVAWRGWQARRVAPVADPAADEVPPTEAPIEAGRFGDRARLVWSALVLAIPTAVLDGWFYLRSLRLYGDPTGSEHLLEKFGRTPRTGPLTIIHEASVWRENLRTMFTRRIENELPTDPLSWWQVLRVVLPVLLIVAIVTIVVDQVRARRGSPARTPALGWAAMVVAVVVVLFLSAQHWSGGGTVHARYLFPALAILVTAVALVLVRYLSVWAGMAMIVLFVAIQARQNPKATEYLAANQIGAVGSQLTQPIGPTWLRFAGVAVMGVALVVLLWALWRVDRPSRPGDEQPLVDGDQAPA